MPDIFLLVHPRHRSSLELPTSNDLSCFSDSGGSLSGPGGGFLDSSKNINSGFATTDITEAKTGFLERSGWRMPVGGC